MKAESVPKINGFSRGVNTLQILSYIVLLSKIFFFSFILIPSFDLVTQIVTSIIYYIPIAVTLISGYLATVSDPTDDIVKEEKKCHMMGEPFDSARHEYQCDHCGTSVSGTSKHCRTCNRCVENFDHHCKWINNCIAGKNYKLFITLIASLAFSCLWFVVNGVVFISDYYSGKLNIILDLAHFKDDASQRWRVIVIMVYTAIVAIFFILDTKLLYFHIYLIRNHMTTYDYILKLRAKDQKFSSPRLSKKGKSKKSKQKQVTPLADMPPQSPIYDGEDKKDFDFEAQTEYFRSSNSSTPIEKLKIKKLANLKLGAQRGISSEEQQPIQNQGIDDPQTSSLKSMNSLSTKQQSKRRSRTRDLDDREHRQVSLNSQPVSPSHDGAVDTDYNPNTPTPHRERPSHAPLITRSFPRNNDKISAENTAVSFFQSEAHASSNHPTIVGEDMLSTPNKVDGKSVEITEATPAKRNNSRKGTSNSIKKAFE